jgi:hypothetical protein
MNFLILDSVYSDFFNEFYVAHPEFTEMTYKEAWRLMMDQAFGCADFYSANLKKLGFEAEEIIINCNQLQEKWAEEHGLGAKSKIDKTKESVKITLKSEAKKILASTGFFGKSMEQLVRYSCSPFLKAKHLLDNRSREIVEAQIKKSKPDILIIHTLSYLDEAFLTSLRPYVKMIVGQHASPIPNAVPYQSYDLMLSSLPNFVEYFRNQGVKSKYFRLGFDPSVLNKIGILEKKFNTTFVGGFSSVHTNGIKILNEVCEKSPIDFWGSGVECLPQKSPIRRSFNGKAFGMDMFRILGQSKIALNRHISIAENYANNMRLYETTGMGAMLLTDMKKNLNDIFIIGKEAVAYTDPQDCIEKINYYLENEIERQAIAKAGQEKTLREHTYFNRMQELIDIVKIM